MTCADKTGIRIQVKLEWLRFAVTPSLSYLPHYPKRGMLAIEAIGTLPQVKGMLVHDGLQSCKQLDCAQRMRELV